MKFPCRLLSRPLRALLILLPLIAVGSCSDGTGVESHVGFYDMTQFRGNTLPSGDGTIYIRSGVIELRSGSRFRLQMDRDYQGATDPVVDEGTFTISNGFITLNTTPVPLTGSIFPGYIRLNDGDPGSIWEKRE